jgi:hypothetical protein
MTIELLELRLRSLERWNARLKVAVLLVAVLAVGMNLTSMSENLWAAFLDEPVTQDTLRANRIEVVDGDGRLLAVLGKLPSGEFGTTTGLALFFNDKQVLELALTKSILDGSLASTGLRISNPADEKPLFSAGVEDFSGGVGLFPTLQLAHRDSKFRSRVDPLGLNVFVQTGDRTGEAAISLYAQDDLSATLMLGGLFKPFKVRAIAEPDKPRLVLEKGEGKNRKIKTYGLGS